MQEELGKVTMLISEWLDKMEAENADFTQLELPLDMICDEESVETVYFKEIDPCGIFCAKNHPFSSVERYGHWYYCRGQDKKAGIHSEAMKWHLFTRDREVALQTAKEHIA
jgi:hypothetical protein